MMVKQVGVTCVLALLLAGCSSSDTPGAAGEPLFPVAEGDRWGYMSADGKTRIRATFDEVLPFSDGLAAVGRRGEDGHTLWGFIDASGRAVVPLRYHDVLPFSEGLAAVIPSGDDDRWGFIDTAGTLAIQPRFLFAFGFRDGLAVATDDESGLTGYIDPKGEWTIEPRFGAAGAYFSDGLANAGVQDQAGVHSDTVRFRRGLQRRPGAGKRRGRNRAGGPAYVRRRLRVHRPERPLGPRTGVPVS